MYAHLKALGQSDRFIRCVLESPRPIRSLHSTNSISDPGLLFAQLWKSELDDDGGMLMNEHTYMH